MQVYASLQMHGAASVECSMSIHVIYMKNNLTD